jgi:hypothetical protein
MCHGEPAELIQPLHQVRRNRRNALESHQSSPYVMKQIGSLTHTGPDVGGFDSQPETAGFTAGASG